MTSHPIRTIVLALLLTVAAAVKAQDFKVASFEQNLIDLTAARKPVKDNNDVECAILRFAVKDNKFEFEPNLGYLKRVEGTGEVMYYVPKGTKLLTIRHPEYGVIRNYRLPVAIESKAVYDCVIEITKVLEKSHPIYAGVAYNVMGMAAPMVSVGINFDGFNMEAGFMMTLGKSDEISIYSKATPNGSAIGSYKYRGMRPFVRMGYEIKAAKELSFTPLVGGAMTMLRGSEEMPPTNDADKCDHGMSVSVTAGLRVRLRLHENISIHVTPEYQLPVYKDNGAKLLYDNKDLEKWAKGVAINAGVLIYF